jgi:protein-S-isoprenylcysteine O-methyltransferase Ste14
LPFDFNLRALFGGGFIIAGLSLDFMGLVAFQKHHTTINPMKPNSSSEIVSDGIYKFTRNPMYLGLCLNLIGWCVINLSCYGFILIPAFIKYIETFQIKPEEEILRGKFGAVYEEYMNKVARWV